MSECCSLQTASLEVIHSIVQLNNVHNYLYVYLINFVTLVLLNLDLFFFESTVDPDQLVSDEAI